MKTLLVVAGLLASASLLTVAPAFAQGAPRRVDLSAQVGLLRLSDFDATSAAIGGRVTFDVSRWIAADAEVLFFPKDNIFLPFVASLPVQAGKARVGYFRRRTDGFFGVKIGRVGQRYGLYAKLRPGLTHLTDRGVRCVGEPCTRMLLLLARSQYRTEFALDFGGGLELHPSGRTVARVEFGDTMIRHRSFAPPCWGRGCTSHNFTTRVGGGVRF